MKKLNIVRKIVKLLHPNVEIIVRYDKNKKIQLIVKNVWYTEFNPTNFEYELFFKNGEIIKVDKFLEQICESNPYVTYENTRWKYIMTTGKVYEYGK